MRSRVLIAALICLAVVIATTACAPRESSVPPSATAGEATPREGGRLIRRFESDVNTLNFVRHTTAFEKNVLALLHDPLIALDQELRLVPALARSWTISDDGLIYRFELDERATFSDGRPVTAEDLIFTLERIVDPKTPSPQYASLFDALDLDRTRAVDERTAEIAFATKRADQLLSFNIPVLPKHYYSRGNFASDFDRRVLGSGPYVLEEHVAGRHILLRRRADYWREKPLIEQVEFRIVPDDAMAWNALRSGQLDETRLTSDRWREVKDDPSIRNTIDIRRFFQLGYSFVPWNTRDPLLSDPRVRRALAMCFNRRAVINNLYYGTARVVTGPYVPSQWAYNPNVKPIEYDPREARALLAEAGWQDSNRDGLLDRQGRTFDLELLLPAGNAPSASQAQVFEQGLREAGINARLTTLDTPVLFERVLSGKFQGAFLAWDLDLDPDVHALFHSSQFPPNGTNFVYYSNPEVDQLIERGRVTIDPVQRQAIYHELHARLAQDQPYLWLIQVSTKWGLNTRVQNVEEAEGLGLFLWHPGPRQWWLADAPMAGNAVTVPR